MGKFYITTPIYYPSDRLHIGHAYTTVAADALARFHRLRGEEVFFLTGTDEHGQKIAKKARAEGKGPQAYVDAIVATIQELWGSLHISYDDFIRTTEPRHAKVVQEVYRKLEAKGDIYKGTYEGWYCTPCETFWTEGKLVDGKCPSCGRDVERLEEESYFLRLQPYAERLKAHILSHPDFIRPESRRNEMLSFIDQGLEDLSVSRTSFDWGIPLPDDPRHVAYVWIDALTNYITAAGYGSDGDRFDRLWPADVHLVGKEIVRFHTIIWPIILLALDLPLPKTVFGHGWLVIGGSKISKSLGNTVDPQTLIERYGVDAVRHYLLREVPFGADGTYTEEALVLRTNQDLANDLGNLLSRATAMIGRFAGGIVPEPPAGGSGLREAAEAAYAGATDHLERLEISDAVEAIFTLVRRANKYIEQEAPWNLARAGDPRLKTVLYDLAESLRVAAVLLRPFLVETPDDIYDQLGLGDAGATTWEDAHWGGLPPGTEIRRGRPLFPRIETPRADATPRPGPEAVREEIDIDLFHKLDLRVAHVTSAKPVKGTDRLLELTLALGDETRTVVSGIAEHYEPESLVGKDVIVVANLAPAKIRGITSRGMILAAKDASTLALLTIDRPVGSGSPVS